jgi:NTE family protein
MTRCPPTLADWLRAEPFSLALSSGFFGFFAHCGMLEALLDAGMTPRAISGSSAGALVGGLWAAGVEVGSLGEELRLLRRADFWDPWPGFGLLRGRLFRERLERLSPVRRFEDCRVKLAVSVFDVLSRDTRVVSEGALVPAIQASCSVPFLFQPTWLDGRPCLDGGVKDRPALAAFPAGTRVLHHHLLPRGSRERDRAPPARPGLTAVVIRDLPRVHPFALDAGQWALRAARDAMRRALAAPVAPVVEVPAG